jgi:hypothetical protein
MKLLIEKVLPGSSYQGKIYDYGIKGKTESGMELRISDWKKFNLKKYEGKIVNCLILAFMAQDINNIEKDQSHDPFHPVLEGTYLGSYKIPEKWREINEDLLLDPYHAVETVDGLLIIDPDELNAEKDEKIVFTVGRLDLKSYIPPD